MCWGNTHRFVEVAGGPLSGFDVGTNSKLAFADLNGDGAVDLLVGAQWGSLNFYANGRCTSSCNSNGVCDPNAFAPVCQCLTGFAGDQCMECQTGYYGPS